MRTLQGTVVSNRMQRTVVVRIDRLRQHPKYRKFYRVSKKYKAHVRDGESPEPGDVVRIQEVRPLSKDKHWEVVAVVARAREETPEGEPEANGDPL